MFLPTIVFKWSETWDTYRIGRNLPAHCLYLFGHRTTWTTHKSFSIFSSSVFSAQKYTWPMIVIYAEDFCLYFWSDHQLTHSSWWFVQKKYVCVWSLLRLFMTFCIYFLYEPHLQTCWTYFTLNMSRKKATGLEKSRPSKKGKNHWENFMRSFTGDIIED